MEDEGYTLEYIMQNLRDVTRYFGWAKNLLIIAALIFCVSGMLQVSITFPFFSDEKHIFEDSLWSVNKEKLQSSVNIESLYSDYYKPHYPGRGSHPNGSVLILGSYIWLLNLFKELNPGNIAFFVLSIHLLLISAILLSLYFVYLLFQEIDEVNGKRIGIVAVAISAIFPPFVAYGGIRVNDTMSLLFLMISLWSFARLVKSVSPSLLIWILPGVATGIFLILKKSGVLVMPVLIIYGLLLSRKWDWKGIGKKWIVTILIAAVVLVITNNPFLYIKDLLLPTSEFQNLTGSFGIRKFGLMGYQVAKFWELLHPDYYHYLGYHRHAGPYIQLLGLINKHLTSSFYLLYIISFFILLMMKRWKEVILLNAPFFILFICLPVFQAYRFIPVFPLALSTIAVSIILLWDRYPKLRYRLATSLVAFLLFLSQPIFSLSGTQVIHGETYLDLGDIASKNRHLSFDRGIFFDRTLSQWKAARLGDPFALVPRREGVIKEKLTFKKAGAYEINLLLGLNIEDLSYLPEIGVKLGDQISDVRLIPKTLQWYRTGPFVIGQNALQQDLIIGFKRINLLSYENFVALLDIRVVEFDQITSKGGGRNVPPTPWWITKKRP